MGISYPTVKNKLDKLLAALGLLNEINGLSQIEIINSVHAGEISVEEALNLLKEI